MRALSTIAATLALVLVALAAALILWGWMGAAAGHLDLYSHGAVREEGEAYYVVHVVVEGARMPGHLCIVVSRGC